MAFIHGKSSQVLHGAYNLGAFLNDASASADVEVSETTSFGSSAKTYLVGLRDGTVSASGMFDGAAGAVDEVLSASIGSDTLAPVTIGYNGTTLGNRVTILKAKTTSYEVSTPVGDVVAVSYSAQADGGLDQGVSLAALASVSATTTGSSHDNSASSANGGVAQLHVTVNTRDADATIKIQHSADDSTFADLATFTVVATTVVTSERVIVASGTTVNRYLRAVNTLSAGTGSITYQVSFARR
jgi:hypothetical protein